LRPPHLLQLSARRAPVAVQNREEHLIQVAAVPGEGLPQDCLLHGAKLEQRAVAPSVLHGSASFESSHAERVEREFEHEFRGVLENSRSPERRANGESPLGRVQTRVQIAHLKDSDCGVESFHRHGKTHVLSRLPLPMRPGDEVLEPFDRRRRRRNEPRHFRSREERKERRGVGRAEIPQHDLTSRQHRETTPPVGANDPVAERRTDLHVQILAIRHFFHGSCSRLTG
jgi:hypothetical protein